MSIISIQNTIEVISGLNECANLFQWVTSAISSLKSEYSETQKKKLQGDIHQLHSDLQCLTDTLPTMYNLIDRAEWRIHDQYVADLLSRLKDAVYDAEDLVDQFRCYEKKVSVEGNGISVDDFFHSVTQGSFNAVTDIQKKLNNLSGHLEKVGILQAIPRFEESLRPETTSLPTEAKIFGRDKEKKQLIRLLGVPTKNSTDLSGRKRSRSGVCSSTGSQVCATNDSNEATIPGARVLPIVGIGGVGKTTLAQETCNNSKVKKHFDLIIWICVSDDFDVKRLTKEAIEQSNREVPKNENLNFLQGALANSLHTRRFLLVLDDMWNENQLDWKRFCAPFRNVLQGSMILVTTRSPKVAKVVRTMDPFTLEGLQEDVFRKFFKLCVFGSGSSNDYPELEQIGEQILPKLKGSPLAAKTLGRLLGMSFKLAHWERILNSQLWELTQEQTDILPALRLSYMYLPFHLKRCFSFCAVYPKDYKFKKKDLAEIWAAEGLVEHQHTGDQYFEELEHLSFFQKYPRSRDAFVIHDLMHDMAQLVSKDECFTVKDTKDILKIPQNVRHLLVLKGGDVKCSDLLSLCKHKKVRTLLCNLSLKSKTGNTVMEKWCAELSCMRVMVCSSISKWGLPGSLSNMKHLRYLKILDSSLCKSLPSEFSCLYNMQIFCATEWSIDDIPSGFVNLINLQKFESVKYQFHHIHSSDINEGGATEKEERRQFTFRNHDGESPPKGFSAQNLSGITSLELVDWDNIKSISSSSNSEQIHSHDSNDSTFSSLTYVTIKYCENLSSLDQFLQPGHVPTIKRIQISACTSLESIPAERFDMLRFLEELHVSNCPKIKSQHLFAPSLKKLYLYNSGNLGYKLQCSSLTIFHLSNYPLEFIELQMWNLELLQKLNISSSPSLTIIRDSEPSLCGPTGKFPKLTHLSIQDCYKLETIDDLLHVPAIENIEIWSCGLLSLPANTLESYSHLKDLNISWCESLDWRSGMQLPSSLQKLTLWSCGDFSACFSSCLENLTSLEQLVVRHCECLVSVPLWCSNLKSLQRLEISHCSKLKSIGGLEAIAHIRVLSIEGCPELKEIDQPLWKRY